MLYPLQVVYTTAVEPNYEKHDLGFCLHLISWELKGVKFADLQS
jgi:hypothetical protein